MRRLAGILIAMSVVLAIHSPAVGGDLSGGEIKKLVDKYVEEKTTQPERDEITSKLRRVGRPDLAKLFVRYFKNDSERPRVMQLAITLKVPGLFKNVKEYFESLDRDLAIRWMLVTHDSEGLGFLFDKWKTLSLDSKNWLAVDEGFRAVIVFAATLDKFQAMLMDVARGAKALAILQFQLSLPDATEQSLKEDWQKLRKDHDRNYREFKIIGYSLLEESKWSVTDTVTLFANAKIGAGGQMRGSDFPETAVDRHFTLTMRVAVLSGKTALMGMFMGSGPLSKGFNIEISDKEISGPRGMGLFIKAHPVKTGEWHEIRWVFQARSGGKFGFDVYADSTRIAEGGEYSAEPTSLDIVSGDMVMLLGGLDLVIEKPKAK